MEHQGQVAWDPPVWLQWAVSSCWSKSSCSSTSWSIAPAGEIVSDAGVLDTHCPYLPKHDGLLTWRPWTPSQTYVICSAQSTALGLALTSWSSSLASFLRRGVNNHQCGSWQWVLYHWPQRPFKDFWRIGTRLDLESAQPETPTEIFSSEGLMLELYSSWACRYAQSHKEHTMVIVWITIYYRTWTPRIHKWDLDNC